MSGLAVEQLGGLPESSLGRPTPLERRPAAYGRDKMGIAAAGVESAARLSCALDPVGSRPGDVLGRLCPYQ